MATLIAPVTALLFAIAAMLTGHGLQATLIPIRAELAHFSDFAIGMMSSSFFVGFVLGCLFVPFSIVRAGHIRAFAAIVSLASAASLIHPLLLDPWSWTLARGLFGFCIAGFYLIVESWLNERTTNKDRGLIMSIYVVVNYAAISSGQVLMTSFDTTSVAPFIVASMFVSFAVVPVALTRSQQPAPITLVRFRPRHLYETSPTAIVACVLMGIAIGAVWTLAPIFATRVGLNSDQAAYFLAAIVVGGGLGQWPFGRTSDFVDRRLVLAVSCAGTIVICLILAFAAPSNPSMMILFGALLGIFMFPGYALAIAHAFDHVDADGHVETSSGLLLAYGMGSIVGPLAASALMNLGGASQLFVLAAVTEAALLAYLVRRLTVREAVTGDDKGEWDLGSTAPIGTVITPEPLDAEDPDVIVPEMVIFEAPSEEDADSSDESEGGETASETEEAPEK